MPENVNGPLRLPSYRGFKKGNSPGKTKNPKVAGTRVQAPLAGAPVIGRAHETQALPFPPMPNWWQASIGEWIVWDYLTRVKKWQERKDFYYQSRVFLPQFYSSRDFTSADFVIDFGPDSAAGMVGAYQALVLDPITPFTHPSLGFDKARRAALEAQGYLLVFIEEADLMHRTAEVMEQALRGIDDSSRGSNG